MGCSPSILSSLSNNNNRKDSGLYCSNNSETNSANNKNDINIDSNTSTALANQILVQSSVTGKDAMNKDYIKKDSIVSVGHMAHGFTIIPSTIRRATIGTSAPSGRIGHRKSSLALTPEEEPTFETTIVDKIHKTTFVTNMVDSCFKVFKSNCFRKSSISSQRSSVFQIDKRPISENISKDKKFNTTANATPIDTDKTLSYDCDVEYSTFELDPNVILRRHNRFYLRSVSATTSCDAMSSEEDDNENLDILYPLPRVNTHERALSEESNQQITDKINSDKNNSKSSTSKDGLKHNDGGRVRDNSNFLKTFFKRKYRRKKCNDGKIPNLIPPNPAVRVLLVFYKDDHIFDAMARSCERLGFESFRAKTSETALEMFQHPVNGGYHLVIVDSRCKNIDVESFGRSLRNSKGSQYTIIIAIVRKSVFEKDDTAVLSMLEVGYNRCIIESPHVSVCCSELRQIQHSLIRPQNVIASQQALYSALHHVKDTIIITDYALRIQYANKTIERILGYKIDEIVGRPLQDLINSDVSLLLSQTNRLKEYDGVITFNRKAQDQIIIHVRATPIACLGKATTHIIIALNHTQIGGYEMGLPSIPQAKEPRGSLHSIRRGSFDIRSITSDGLRRTSLAKLSSLPLEAPITKVLSILAQVQENCSNDEAKLLDRVIEFLKREGLYSPQIKEIRPEDPVATDLIGALLTQGPSNNVSSRRSSNESIIRSGSRQSSSGNTAIKFKTPPQVSELLSTALDWDFEIFRLEELTDKNPLVFLGMELLRRFDVFNTFNCDEITFRSWLIVVESHYHSINTYHNSTHAADVMQATACYLQQLANRDLKIMDRLDEATALIASAAHDIDHPGRSSAYLCNSDNSLAILYNDVCVLESHHAATTFRLTLSDDKINIFKNLDRDMYKLARSVIIDMILATEMTRHFEHLAKFVSVFGNDVENKDVPNDEDNQMLIRRMLIKCSDVNNPTRPLKFCVEWARRIAEEYFTQTDEEKRKGMPIVMPMFDRASCSISKSQIGFIEFIIQDMMNAWDGFIDMPELIQYMQYNYDSWKTFEVQGINTLSDIKRKQMSISNQNDTQHFPNVKLDEVM
ncbi:CLUMA_CG000166, isoform A [Clunio marinus]|uniref:3',5'-cyclic-AMP phosphodiesterase n=1 Tax=Clunio marinus TaxID=568069 RepID=A0A1J1HIG6_9DIPT|nr:CLUMA_CG000166, isoform A [Clunio marinus]